MTDEVSLLKVLESRDGYLKYSRQVSEHALSEEVQTLVADIGVWFDTDPKRTKVSWAEFDPWFRIVRHSGYKEDKKKYFRELFERLSHAEKSEPDKDIIERFRAVEAATKIGDIAADVLQGHGDVGLVDEVMAEWKRGRLNEADMDRFVKPSIGRILDMVARKGGIHWRLKCLNDSLGPLHKGDLVVFGKRPESGGTSWLASELTFMAPQTEGRILIFNNEEMGEKIQLRLYQAALNKTAKELVGMESQADALYAEALGGDPHKILVYDQPRISVREVEHLCREVRPSILAFNTLPKVHGFHEEKNDIKRLQKLAQWARELAKEWGPVFGVWQADGTAEGEKWLDASKLAWSKTDVQGECDVLLMLGRTHTPAERDVRFLNIVKNKMVGLHDDAPRHTQHTLKFDGARARYGDM